MRTQATLVLQNTGFLLACAGEFCRLQRAKLTDKVIKRVRQRALGIVGISTCVRWLKPGN